LNQVPERLMHIIRWGLATSWLILIASLFYDPLSSILTAANNSSSPFRIHPDTCVLVQGHCLPQTSYSLGVRLFWAVIVPAAILIIFVFGHEAWRRICPLSFLSQLPRALKFQRQRKIVSSSGIVSSEPVFITEDSWLGQNHLYVQFGLLFGGLTARLLVLNSHPLALGIFLVFTILCAVSIGFLFAGKSWCNYFCPFAPVQAIFIGPRGLLGSQAHQADESLVPQSMCRTPENESACVGCKAACIDIDAEQAYWDKLEQPARQFVQYGYVGLLVAFFLYFYLFAGNWDYYFSGMWSRDDAIGMLFQPGFYLAGHAIPLPKLVAVPLTLAIFTVLSYLMLVRIEKTYRAQLRRQSKSPDRHQSHHTIFTLVTVCCFWFFFTFGGRPILNTLPAVVGLGFNAIVLIAGSIWGYRTLGRTHVQYLAEQAPPISITAPAVAAVDRTSKAHAAPTPSPPNTATVTPSNNRSIPTLTPNSSPKRNRSLRPTRTPKPIVKSAKFVGVDSLQEHRPISLDTTHTRPKS
jgi:hypothetical protein